MSPTRRSRQANRRTIIDMLETTPAQVSRVRTPAPEDEQIGHIDFDWRPQPLERVVSSGRSFRWPIIGAAIVLAAIAIVAVQGLGTISDAQADERLAAYRTSLEAFSVALDEMESALPSIDLDTALAFSAATEALRATASEDLPGLPPFVPQGALGDVADAKSQLLSIVDVSSLVSADLDIAASYESASSSLFAVPPLPTSAPVELLDAASEAITNMQAETLATLAGLDPDPRFETYAARVSEALDTLPDWADRYLLALRNEDTAATNALIVEITARQQLLRAELDVGLGVVAESARNRIDDIRSALDDVRVLTATS